MTRMKRRERTGAELQLGLRNSPALVLAFLGLVLAPLVGGCRSSSDYMADIVPAKTFYEPRALEYEEAKLAEISSQKRIEQIDLSVSRDGTVLLIATPISGDPSVPEHEGCVVFAFEDFASGRLRRDGAGRALPRAILTGDTTAMHVAIALRVPAVVLFGPTCPQEVDTFGRGRKLVSSIPCAPCYKRHCDLQPNCMDALGVAEAEAALVGYLGRRKALPLAVVQSS